MRDVVSERSARDLAADRAAIKSACPAWVRWSRVAANAVRLSGAPAAGEKSNQQSAQQEKPKEEKRRGYCGPKSPIPPEPASRTTTGMAAKAPDFVTSCSAEKAYMEYEYRKLCMNGAATWEFEREAAQIDAAGARSKLNEALHPTIVYKDDSLPESQALTAWRICLLKTRLRQLGEE